GDVEKIAILVDIAAVDQIDRQRRAVQKEWRDPYTVGELHHRTQVDAVPRVRRDIRPELDGVVERVVRVLNIPGVELVRGIADGADRFRKHVRGGEVEAL